MKEIWQGLGATLALLPTLVFSVITMLGGRSFSVLGISARIWKRIIAPVSFVSLLIVLSLINKTFTWWILSLYATYFVSCMVGYGNDSIWGKIYRRSLWSLIRTLACLPIAILTGSYILLAIQCMVGLIATVFLGVWNPLKAPAEEFLINFVSVLFVPFMLVS